MRISHQINFKKSCMLIFFMLILTCILASCGFKSQFVILSGSENTTLEPIIQEFANRKNIEIKMNYKGSLDIMQDLSQTEIPYDAVWPANSLWISMGDKNHVVKHQKSIMISPVVFGIKKSLAVKLGFTGRQVAVKDILTAVTNHQLTFMMTSASQSNSGASAYFGFLYALLGNPETITIDDLHRPELKEKIKELLTGVNRSSGSSDWLKDLFLRGNYEAMVNYESLIIETNQELIRRRQEPLYVVYPYDGIVLADSPLGYVNHNDSQKEQLFMELQNYLLSTKVQQEILKLGRRTGFGGMLGNVDPAVFNPDWGIDTKKVLSPIKLPSVEVIQEALNLYQTEFKKPSYTVFCLDFSGSMGENGGEAQLKQALELLLNQDKAKQYYLQGTPDDVYVIYPFNSEILATWQAKGNNNNDLLPLYQKVAES